jgi:DNA-binding NarL/FixJ family response regulator
MLIADLIRAALTDVEGLTRKLVALQARVVELEGGNQAAAPLKKANGRLTESGVRRLNALIDAGYSNAEIARSLEIRQSSVPTHRKRYLQELQQPIDPSR